MRIEKRLREKAFTIVHIVHENRFELCYRHRTTKEELAQPVQEWKHLQRFGYFNTYEDAKALMDRLLKVEWKYSYPYYWEANVREQIILPNGEKYESAIFIYRNGREYYCSLFNSSDQELFPSVRNAQIAAYDIMVKGGLI